MLLENKSYLWLLFSYELFLFPALCNCTHPSLAMYFAGTSVYTEENTQASTGSFGSNSENLNEDSNMSFPENSESNTMPEYSQDSNDADPEMRVGKQNLNGLLWFW